MSTGFLALLDDVAAIAKMAASSIDDVAAQAAKAGTKAAGVVIDDAAVTPQYVMGISPKRELPIIAKIAAGSLRNKLLILLPAALLLSLAAPWAITPLLMIGGVYLCYEGAEKLFEAFWPHNADEHEAGLHSKQLGPDDIEREMVSGAIRTDFILSAEIMAITLAAVPDAGFWTQAVVLASVGIGITLAVYGVVAIIVKIDDFGFALVRNSLSVSGFRKLVRAFGRALVVGTPVFLKLLAAIGTAAMLWVGGNILVHGIEHHGFAGPARAIERGAEFAAHAAPQAPAVAAWLASAGILAVVGLAVGAVTIPLAGKGLVPAYRWVRTAFSR
jgi:uncharacterized protein